MNCRILTLAIALLALGSCGDGGDPVADEANSAARLPDAESTPPDEMTGQGDAERGAAIEPAAVGRPAANIPPALRGAWALSPGDCAARGGQSTGLLIVTQTELRFHDSRAIPVSDIGTSPDYISGTFAFTGEGKAWTRNETLQLQGNQLLRSETQPTESYTYARCR